MFWHRKEHRTEIDERRNQADAALEKSVQDYEALQTMRPTIERTVRGHMKLQFENHFAERIDLAYRGEF